MLRVMDLKIAAVVDDFTEFCLSKECHLINLSKYQWNSQLQSFSPDFLFVESAWRGYQNEWTREVTKYGSELDRLLQWCRAHNIPTVFWNKEDPVHFNSFFNSAKHFDWVFTTDIDSIPMYKMLLKHPRVGLFPFASSFKVFHPIEQYARNNAISFAGSYYRKRVERSRVFDEIYDQCTKYMEFHIYDRNSHPGDAYYSYPERYRRSIRGSLPISQIDKAYKQYRFGLTMNTVQHSSTMEARRIFELMASNTITVSNECKAVRTMFGDLAVIYTGNDHLEQLKKLSWDIESYQKQRLLALRKILMEHTYAQRIAYVAGKVLNQPIDPEQKTIHLTSYVRNQAEADAVMDAFQRQTYRPRNCSIISDAKIKMKPGTKLVTTKQVKYMNSLANSDYYAYLNPNNYYGKNYINDLMLALKYSEAEVIGKGSRFYSQNGKFVQKTDVNQYSYGNGILLDKCIVPKSRAKDITLASLMERQLPTVKGRYLSIDEYNYCENYKGMVCEKVDDLRMNTGKEMRRLYEIAESLDESKLKSKYMVDGEELYHKLKKNESSVRTSLSGQELTMTGNEMEFQTYVTDPTIYQVKDYLQGNQITLFLRCETEGSAKLVVLFLNEFQQVIRSVAISPNCYIRLNVPEKAETFTIRLAIAGQSTAKWKGLYMNPVVELD